MAEITAEVLLEIMAADRLSAGAKRNACEVVNK